MSDYAEFLARKALTPIVAGYDDDPEPHMQMFPHQADAFRFLIRIGRGAAFLETGLGKALLALHWAQTVAEREGRPVLIFAPLAVAQQFVREGRKFDVPCRYVRNRDELRPGVNATNYDRLDGFSPDDLAGVVLDESGILKALTGATKRALIDFAQPLRFRLCCSATPAPNDHMELGNHAEFLGVMNSNEMLSRFFVNDTSTASQVWRLKGHAKEAFWDWIATWAFGMTKPSDLGYSDEGFILPRLDVIKHVVDVDITKDRGDTLFRIAAIGSMDLHREKRLTLRERVEKVAEVVHGQPGEDWLVWCHSNGEADALAAAIPDAIEVRGNDTVEYKIHAAEWFCRYREDRPWRGSRNTRTIESESEPLTHPAWQSIKSNIPSLTERSGLTDISTATMKTTKKSGNVPKNSGLSAIDAAENDMQPTPYIGNITNPKLEHDAKKLDETAASNRSMGSLPSNTTRSLPRKAEVAPSADDQTMGSTVEPARTAICASTIAIKPAPSEGFSAQTAITPSANLEMIQRNSSERQDISDRRVMISKARIFGWGMNFQGCARMAFVGINFSFEEGYQAIRRCWRFGQKREVEVHIVVAPTEAGVWDAVMRKQQQHDDMKVGLMAAMKRAHGSGARRRAPYLPRQTAAIAPWIRSV